MSKYHNAGWILAIFFAGLFLGSLTRGAFESTAQAQQGVVSQQTERRVVSALEGIERYLRTIAGRI